MTEGGTSRLIQALVNQTQFCVSFIALWSLNGSFQTPQSCQFLNLCLFRSLPLVMNLRQWLIEYYLKCNQQRWDFCEEFAVWHSVTKRAAVKLNVEPLLGIERSQRRWFGHVSRMPHERLARQVLLAVTTGKRPRGRPRTRWNDYISNLALIPCLCGGNRTSEIGVDREVFPVLLKLLWPPFSSKEKWARKWMDEQLYTVAFHVTVTLITTW